MARRRYQKGCLLKRGKDWVLRFREDVLDPDGGLSRTHRSVVLGYFETKKEARRAADSYLLPFNSETRRPQAAITLEDFWRKHFELEIMPALKFSTQQGYRYLAETHLLRFFGMHRLGEISRLDV